MTGLWPIPIPKWFWQWARWRLGHGEYASYGPALGPRPTTAPKRIPKWAWTRIKALGTPAPPPAPVPASIFDRLGGFVASASAFPPDSAKADAFVRAGGKWLAVQHYDPATHDANEWELVNAQWAERWRTRGVEVLGWHRVEHLSAGSLLTDMGTMDGWVFNAEAAHELVGLASEVADARSRYREGHLAVVTLGKLPLFPTGILDQYDVHLLVEMFGKADPYTVFQISDSIKWWLDSDVPRSRMHGCLLFRDHIRTDPGHEAATLLANRLVGVSSFVAENTPAAAWQVMA